MALLTSSRRGFLIGLSSLVAAPAIVRAENIMKVRPLKFVESLENRWGVVTIQAGGFGNLSPYYIRMIDTNPLPQRKDWACLDVEESGIYQDMLYDHIMEDHWKVPFTA